VNEIYAALLRGHCTDFDNPIYYNIEWMKLLAEKSKVDLSISANIKNIR